MKPCYIHSATSISAQPTFESDVLHFEMIAPTQEKIEAIHPNYKDFMSPIALRRMATGVKMGVAAATKALQLSNTPQPDAILIGTGMGCIEDTEKFLNAMIANEEEFLTPTAFIQSTHNTVGAQIALGIKCKAYNNTYVHGALSFESALLDAQLMLQNDEATNILVGGVDELGTEFVDAVRMMEDKTPDGIKCPIGEGASFFVLSSKYKNESVQLVDVIGYSSISQESLTKKTHTFLHQNNLSFSDIDALILGANGDAFDTFYDEFASVFPETIPTLSHKQWSGEFFTASGFALFLSYEILKLGEIPSNLLQNKTAKSDIKTILLYNQFKGRDHSFMLLKSC